MQQSDNDMQITKASPNTHKGKENAQQSGSKEREGGRDIGGNKGNNQSRGKARHG